MHHRQSSHDMGIHGYLDSSLMSLYGTLKYTYLQTGLHVTC